MVSLARWSQVLFLPLIFCLLCSNTNAASQSSVTVLPFATPREQRYTHLQDGLASMLASRLAERTGLNAVHPGPLLDKLQKNLSDQNANQLTAQLQGIPVDYIVTGSLLPANDQLHLTVRVQHKQQQPKIFSTGVASEADLFQAIDTLSRDIAEQMFGKKRPVAFQAGEKGNQSAGESFATPHPDRVYRDRLLSASGEGASMDALIIAARRSRQLPFELRALDAGDLDGDGQDELVLASGQEIHIYQFSGEHFAAQATMPIAKYVQIHAVTLADINRDGRPEIYVSCNNDDQALSWILSWDGKTVSTLAAGLPWYLRPVELPGQGSVLMGQQAGLSSPVASTIHRVALGADGVIQRGETVALPTGVNLFDFAYAELNQQGPSEIIAIQENRLMVYAATGELLWKSGEGYGASKFALGKPPAAIGYENNRVFVPPRLVVQDLDGDGASEVLVVKNIKTAIAYLPNFSSFEGGSIEALTWKNGALQQHWNTRSVPGYIAGIQMTRGLSQQKKPASPRLYFGENSGEGLLSFFSQSSCLLHAYTLTGSGQ